MFVPQLDRTGVRKLLDQIPTDADFDAFCLDIFPATHARFTSGMDRIQKTTLLLQVESDPTRIADKLHQRFANVAMGAHESALPRRRRGLVFAGVAVALLVAAGLLMSFLRGNNPEPISTHIVLPGPSLQPTDQTSDSVAPTPPPAGGRLAVEHDGDIHAKGRVNITAPSGTQDTSVKTRGQINAGGDVNIGVTTPDAQSSVPRSKDARP